MSYQEKKKLLIYKILIKKDNDWKKFSVVYKNVFDFENARNELMRQKNSGIIEDFKLIPVDFNEDNTTLKEFVEEYGELSISDFVTLVKALE